MEMIEFTFYFEIFGKKMKTKIVAQNEAEAVKILRSKIEIKKVEKRDPLERLQSC